MAHNILSFSLLSILATTVMPVAASSQTPSIQSDQNEDFIAEIERFLAESVFAFPDSYHISQFSSFSLGKAIPSFVWDDEDNCVVESTAKVYPLVKDGVVLGLLHAYSLGQNKYAFSYSEGQVDAINQAHDNIAFYSNGVNVRILHESELIPLEESIFMSVTYSSPYEEYVNINVDGCTPLATLSNPDGHVLSVPLKKQTTPKSCWAACVASVAQYLTGRTYSCSDIYTGASMDETIDVVRNLGLTATNAITSIDIADLMDYICDDSPILGGFLYAGNRGHMMVIRGYSSGSNHFALLLMDPIDASYVSVQIISSHNMSFSYAGYSWNLNEYSAVSK